jgi:hypothetical protein
LRLLLLSFLLVGCGSSTELSECVPGASQPCACTDGLAGAQTCDDDGTFGSCVCTRTDGGITFVDAAAPDDAAPPDDAATPQGDAIPFHDVPLIPDAQEDPDAAVPDAASPDAISPDAGAPAVPPLAPLTAFILSVVNNAQPFLNAQMSVHAVDAISGAPLRTFNLGATAIEAICIDRPGARMFLVNVRDGLEVRSTRTGALLASVPMTTPMGCLLSPDGTRLYVGTYSGVSIVDTATLEITDTETLTNGVQAGIMALAPDSPYLAVRGITPARLHILDADTLAPVTSIDEYFEGLAFDDRGHLLALQWQGNLLQLDPATLEELDRVQVPASSGWVSNTTAHMTYNPAVDRAYTMALTDFGASVTAVDGFTVEIIESYPISEVVSAIVRSPAGDAVFAGRRAYSTTAYDYLSRIDAVTGDVDEFFAEIPDPTRAVRDFKVALVSPE